MIDEFQSTQIQKNSSKTHNRKKLINFEHEIQSKDIFERF